MKREKEKKNMFHCIKSGGADCVKDILGGLACDICSEWKQCGNCARKDSELCKRCENGQKNKF